MGGGIEGIERVFGLTIERMYGNESMCRFDEPHSWKQVECSVQERSRVLERDRITSLEV